MVKPGPIQCSSRKVAELPSGPVLGNPRHHGGPSQFWISIFLSLVFLGTSGRSELLVYTHGHITWETYVHGTLHDALLQPGQRSDFFGYVDLYRWKNLTFSSLLGTTTLVSKNNSSHWQMDRIRYTLTPMFRYEFREWMIRTSLLHECIHNIGRPEVQGSIWWNALQLGIGSKGSYFLYLRDQYRNVNNSLLNSWDAQLVFSAYKKAQNSLLTGQNHEYRCDLQNLIRYHIGAWRNLAGFAGFRQTLWIRHDRQREYKAQLTLNVFLKGMVNFAGIFYTYTFYDSNQFDREDRLGMVGVKVIF